MRFITFDSIPARTKMGLLIGGVNTIIVIVIAVIIMISAYVLGRAQIRTALSAEAEQLVSQHLIYGEDRIMYSLDDNGSSIEADLLSDGASAVIYNKNLESIGRFGIFEFEDAINEEITEVSYSTKLTEVMNSGKPEFYSESEFTEDGAFEALLYPVIKKGEAVGIIAIFMPLVFFQRLMTISMTVFLLVIPLSIVINYILGQYIARRIFRPLHNLTKQMDNITVHNMAASVKPEGNPQDDVYVVAERYNDMLARVQEGVQKQREFVANASHELKSPLARAVSRLDVLSLMVKSDDKNRATDTIKGVSQDLLGLADTIEHMLVLARISESEESVEVFDPKREMSRIAEGFGDSHIDISSEGDLLVEFPPKVFETLIHNLIANAVKHGEQKEVRCLIKKEGNTIIIEISNSLAKGVIVKTDKLLKRHFSTAKEKGTGYGIGLSIVKHIIDLYGLSISFTQKDAVFTVQIQGFPTGR